MKFNNKLIGAGLLTSFAASLYCITTVLALAAGAGGLASNFSWLEPFRPYLTGFTVLVLGLAWYQKLKPGKQTGKNCGAGEKQRFMQSGKFLGIVTGFAVLMLTFPLYAHIFYPDTEKQVKVVDESDIRTVEFKINGLTCDGAEQVKQAVFKLDGTVKSSACHKKENAIVKFDHTKTTLTRIEEAINNTGYTVAGRKTEDERKNRQ